MENISPLTILQSYKKTEEQRVLRVSLFYVFGGVEPHMVPLCNAENRERRSVPYELIDFTHKFHSGLIAVYNAGL